MTVSKQKEIKVSVTSGFGKEFFYPECDISKLLSDLAQQRSFTLADIELIKKIGFEVEVVKMNRLKLSGRL